MRNYLLLWRPAGAGVHLGSTELQRAIDRGASIYWICGRAGSIRRGDRLFLLGNGRDSADVFLAAGTARSSPFAALDWNERRAAKGHTALFVSCTFERILRTEGRRTFDLDKLRKLAPEFFDGKTLESGLELPDSVGDALEALFAGPPVRTEARAAEDRALEAVEGTRIETARYVTGRSRTLRDAALQLAEGVCECCRVDYSKVLGGTGVRVLQVHHRKQLASSKAPRVTRVVDLAVVCANCHSLIHADPKRAMKVEDLRARLREDRRA